MKRICWLFCTVIDNFGDIGVSWRLANELQRRLGWQVYLWLDNDAALRAIVPDTPAVLPCRHRHIELRCWQEGQNADLDGVPPPDCVIETFACQLPPAVLNSIRRHRPLWLNWEYLSAEDWAVRTHAMPSLQADGSAKYFWQMGFCPQSGGLLREDDYLGAPLAFRLPENRPDSLKILIFSYHSPVWGKWLDTLAELQQPLDIWLAGSQTADSLRQSSHIPPDSLRDIGSSHTLGHITLHRIPFVAQTQFDCLLAAADILCLRGEDSFIRGQYAAKPMFWHIYPQQEQAHIDKLHAFWQLFWQHGQDFPVIQAAHQALSDELNGAADLTAAQRRQSWQTLLQHYRDWQHLSHRWRQYLFQQSDTVSRLQQWIQKNHRDLL